MTLLESLRRRMSMELSRLVCGEGRGWRKYCAAEVEEGRDGFETLGNGVFVLTASETSS